MNNIVNIDRDIIYDMIEFYTQNSIDTKPDYKLIKYPTKEQVYEWKSFINHFGYAIPTKKVINKIKLFVGNKSVLEIGAGLGLWSYLLQDSEVNIKCVDSGEYKFDKKAYMFTYVEQIDGLQAIKKYNPSVLLLIWPPLTDMDINMVKNFKGTKIIYIGEPTYGEKFTGLSGSPEFWIEIEKNWNIDETIVIPRYFKDMVFLISKKTTG